MLYKSMPTKYMQIYFICSVESSRRLKVLTINHH